MPRWAFLPLSGAGSAGSGGRFNWFGQGALYLPLDAATAIAEYQRADVRLPPLTLCTYRATTPAVVDLRRLGEGSWQAPTSMRHDAGPARHRSLYRGESSRRYTVRSPVRSDSV